MSETASFITKENHTPDTTFKSPCGADDNVQTKATERQHTEKDTPIHVSADSSRASPLPPPPHALLPSMRTGAELPRVPWGRSCRILRTVLGRILAAASPKCRDLVLCPASARRRPALTSSSRLLLMCQGGQMGNRAQREGHPRTRFYRAPNWPESARTHLNPVSEFFPLNRQA